MNTFIAGRKDMAAQDRAEIKNESVTPARKQTYTDGPSAVQCKAFLRNPVFMITEIGAQVSDLKKCSKGRLYKI
jgi:hypothetical protein